jgi:hypothetical protein
LMHCRISQHALPNLCARRWLRRPNLLAQLPTKVNTMRILLIGVNHMTAPVEVRELLTKRV